MRPPRFKTKPSGVALVIAVLLLASAAPVEAFWRLLCHGTLGTARIDPLVNFGEVAPHAHNIAGAQNFTFFSDAEDLMGSNCTSCSVTEDRSVYWTPALYFQHESNGSFELVPTVGGMTVYYFNDNLGLVNDSNGNLVPPMPLTAFPPGFRMLAGSTTLRDFPYANPDRPMSNWKPSDMTQEALVAKAIGFNCLNYTQGHETEGAMVYHYLRNKTFLDAECLDGVRFELEFPSCWNGKDLDSEDHKSHILYPNLIKTGACPDGFNVRTPVLFYETIWDTYHFVNYTGTFVIANGDPLGYGYHGDFISGWNQSFLQQAVNTCTNTSGRQEDCVYFNIQDDTIATSCFLSTPEELEDENVHGPMPTLPGNMPIFSGPAPAPEIKGTPITGTTELPPLAVLAAASTFGAVDTAGSAPPSPATSSTDSATTPTPATPPMGSTDAAAAASSMSKSTALASSASTLGSVYAAPSAVTTAAPSTVGSNVSEIVITTTYTSNGEEVHLVLFEEISTVTQTFRPAKRHNHKNGHGRGRGRAYVAMGED